MTSSCAAPLAPTERTPLILREMFPNTSHQTINEIVEIVEEQDLYGSFGSKLEYMIDLLSEAEEEIPSGGDQPTEEENYFKRVMSFLTCRAFCCGGTALEEQVNESGEETNLMTCQICFDDQIALERCFFCMKSCVFCEGCTKRGIETRMADGEINFPCFLNCGSEISFDTIQSVLSDAAFKTLIQKLVSNEVQKAKIEGLESCPHCNFAMILPHHENTFSCMNEECKLETCRRCKRAPHVPLRCDQVEYDEDVRRRTYIENKMTEALTRTCYKCKKTFIKTDGCNKMKCPCGAIMCYLCREAIDGYEHFQTGQCALFSDDNAINLERILRNADRAKQDLGNIKLKVDPTRGIREYYTK